MALELEDVPVHSLVPEPLRGCATADEYLARLPEHDGDMATQLAEASAAGECLRYVGALGCWRSRCDDTGPTAHNMPHAFLLLGDACKTAACHCLQRHCSRVSDDPRARNCLLHSHVAHPMPVG